MAVGDAYVFPGILTPVLTQLFFPKPPTTFLTCFCRGERRKHAGKKSHLNRGSNSKPPGHESDMLITESPGWDSIGRKQMQDDSKSAICLWKLISFQKAFPDGLLKTQGFMFSLSQTAENMRKENNSGYLYFLPLQQHLQNLSPNKVTQDCTVKGQSFIKICFLVRGKQAL